MSSFSSRSFQRMERYRGLFINRYSLAGKLLGLIGVESSVFFIVFVRVLGFVSSSLVFLFRFRFFQFSFGFVFFCQRSVVADSGTVGVRVFVLFFGAVNGVSSFRRAVGRSVSRFVFSASRVRFVRRRVVWACVAARDAAGVGSFFGRL